MTSKARWWTVAIMVVRRIQNLFYILKIRKQRVKRAATSGSLMMIQKRSRIIMKWDLTQMMAPTKKSMHPLLRRAMVSTRLRHQCRIQALGLNLWEGWMVILSLKVKINLRKFKTVVLQSRKWTAPLLITHSTQTVNWRTLHQRRVRTSLVIMKCSPLIRTVTSSKLMSTLFTLPLRKEHLKRQLKPPLHRRLLT